MAQGQSIPSARDSQEASTGPTMETLSQPWSLGIEVTLGLGSPIRDNIQNDNPPDLDGVHKVPPETQEEMDPGLKTHLSSVTSALGDMFSENTSGIFFVDWTLLY